MRLIIRLCVTLVRSWEGGVKSWGWGSGEREGNRSGEGVGGCLRATCCGGQEDLEHVEVLEAELGDDDRWGGDARGGQGSAE